MNPDDGRRVPRRDFVKAAVAIGGANALAACLDREGSSTETEAEGETDRSTEEAVSGPQFPRGVSDPTSLPDRQHAWNEYLVSTAHGTFALPQHQVILGLDYEGSVPPTDAERERVEAALRTLERAFSWGTGDRESTGINNGLLFTLGYTPRYFDRLDTSVDGLVDPADLLERAGEDPSKADDFDALLVLNSDYGSIALAAEAALFGDEEALPGEPGTVNGAPIDDTFEGIFSVADRRSGVVGRGRPAEELDNDDIPDNSPLSMGFRSSFADALPSESSVTIESGPFAGGTTQMVSRLSLDLDRWYDQPHEDRVKEMYCPAHSEEDVGEIGDRLGRESGITEADTERIADDAEEQNVVGHSQKVARARDENFEAVILRRSESVATDDAGGTAFNFTSVQETIEDFLETRKAMNVEEYDVDVPEERHGIIDYIETVSRATALIPPRGNRALPDPT